MVVTVACGHRYNFGPEAIVNLDMISLILKWDFTDNYYIKLRFSFPELHRLD